MRHPVRSGTLALDHGHTMYFEEWGRPDGLPVVYLHGGPGAAMEGDMRSVHDPGVVRLVMFDQRGCGRSTPAGELAFNDTAHLVDDIERLRSHLGIERWVVSGGSWGSTLALLYAQAHPGRCLALVLRGLFLGTGPEMDWLAEGAPRFFPEAWFEATGAAPGQAPLQRLKALQDAVLAQGDAAASLRAALALARFEWTAAAMQADRAAIDAELTPDYTSAYQRVCCHFLRNGCFIDPDALLAGIDRIRHLPCHIVNGRFDVVCPPAAAWRLKRAWPEAELEIVPMAGHTPTEPAMADALRGVMQRLTGRLATTFRADP
ncbi:MAG: prolyl aminopeptidase [Pseudomonadota bacterium]|nr:prolyl aminopeptidase [Rubrivivax sp.]